VPQSRKTRRVLLRGIGASRGLAMGPAFVLLPRQFQVPSERVPAEQLASEIRRFRGALRRALADIRQLRERLGPGESDPAAQILASHEMLLQDRELVQEIAGAIKSERMNAAQAVRTVLWGKARYLESLPSELFRSRAGDVRDVEHRLLAQLLGADAPAGSQVPAGAIVVAAELTPSETAAFDPECVAAFVTEHGTLASHVTILARSRGVPAVIGVTELTANVSSGALIIVDGETGELIVGPTQADVAAYEHRRRGETRMGVWLDASQRRPGKTRDGRRVPVEANIDRPDAAAAAVANGAEGIGLFRTEFLFMGAEGIPQEEEQYCAYRMALEAAGDRPVTMRTLDLGGDKTASLFGLPQEANPFLGLRGIRLSLEQPEVFRAQARALLRSAAHGRLRVLLPMISSVDEVRRARALFEEAAGQLEARGVEVAGPISLGVMIEVPSAVTLSDALAREADFFSIGSNDLTQYLLAVDRGNERIAALYDPLHPALLRAMRHCVDEAHRAGLKVGCCGELASDVLGALMLVGLGIDELSVTPIRVGWIKGLLAQVRAADLEELARHCLQAECGAEVHQAIRAGLAAYPQFRVEEQGHRLVCLWEPEM
jgi:phosphoenolpyruvate-protein phosphotransferase (PTS system enzyme I)